MHRHVCRAPRHFCTDLSIRLFNFCTHTHILCYSVLVLVVHLLHTTMENTENMKFTNSAADVGHFPQHSGIRAMPGKMNHNEIKPTSTLLPCQHCTDEAKKRNNRNPLEKICYYCRQPGHKIHACKRKETDEATQLIRRAINEGIQEQDGRIGSHQEMIVVGTEGGLWNDIWYVSSVFKHHIAGNLNVFKRIKHIIGVNTRTGEHNFLFTRGVGSIEIKNGNENMRIQSVFYSPELDRNVLSLDQLTLQGFTVKKAGDTCRIYPMFSCPVNNSFNETSGMTREEELGLQEKQKIIEENVLDEEFKQRYLNSYFEDLNLSSQESDWSVMIVNAMEFREFEDCRAFMNMLDDRDFVVKYKHILDAKFEELVRWFLNSYMGIRSRQVPPVDSHKRKVNLLSLYLLVAMDGGYHTVTTENIWPAIAKDLGFNYEDGDYIRATYAAYLDVLEYYYNFNHVQPSVQDKRMIRDEGTSSSMLQEGLKSAGSVKDAGTGSQNAGEMESVVLFAGVDDDDWSKGKRRKRFNFNYAKWAMDEANRSVMDQARKHNLV
ncbi:putative transcription factor interactor and regulator CCHC(Zn) family [Helianthus annuus]|nr:putative transcription factor interactor and regulator CCHC(Zn) family [Helianthus annuus]